MKFCEYQMEARRCVCPSCVQSHMQADAARCVPESHALRPDPELGTREGWVWCPDCQAIQPPTHAHDSFEDMSRANLLQFCRATVEADAEAYWADDEVRETAQSIDAILGEFNGT